MEYGLGNIQNNLLSMMSLCIDNLSILEIILFTKCNVFAKTPTMSRPARVVPEKIHSLPSQKQFVLSGVGGGGCFVQREKPSIKETFASHFVTNKEYESYIFKV